MMIFYFPHFFYIYQLKFFCKEDASLPSPPLFIYLFIQSFTYISRDSYIGGVYNPIILLTFFKLFQHWSLGTLSGRLLCSFDITPSLHFSLSLSLEQSLTLQYDTMLYTNFTFFLTSLSINHFSKEPTFLLLENCIGKPRSRH